MQLNNLSTPSLILDKPRLDTNIKSMQERLSDRGVSLRPHLKTCKSLDVAKRMIKPGNSGITVSTLHEAEYFLNGGYTDILYAVSIVPQKLTQVKKLQDKGATVTLLLDSVEAALLTSKAGIELETTFPCLIEIDCDGKRAGLAPNDPALIKVAQCLHHETGTTLNGVMTHAGGSYYCQTIGEIAAMAEQERLAITDAAAQLKDNNLPCPVVSLGSTPTATYAESFDGVTEVRAGVYVFQDMVMEALDVCNLSDIAISVLATVISHKTDQNRILVDAGSLALSADPGKKNTLGQSHYGQVCALETCTPYPGIWVNSSNQEHGLISLENSPLTFSNFPIGSRIRILPNHACITAASYSGYHITEGGEDITDYWERCNGW